MKDESFPASARLKSSREFERVFKQGVVVADDTLVLHAIPIVSESPDPPERVTRLGISISKRVGNAPLRNRWKRLIREAFRKQRLQMPACDYIVRPKKDATPDYERIYKSLPTLAKRAAKKLAKH